MKLNKVTRKWKLEEKENELNVICPHCEKLIKGNDLKNKQCSKCKTNLLVEFKEENEKIGIFIDKKLSQFKAIYETK